jgi:malonyl CoA-acyl carrier protein transacylase
VITGLLGYFLGYHQSKIITPDESVIDSLESLKASYESITDSLFLLRTENDSLNKQKIREVTKYCFIESVRYIEKQTGIDSIQTAISDSDSIAIMHNQELQVISGKLAELEGLQEQVRLDSAIINAQAENIRVSDTLLIIKDEQIFYEKQQTKKAKRKFFSIGAGTGAALIGLLWILL